MSLVKDNMQGQRYQVIKQLDTAEGTYLLKDGKRHHQLLWSAPRLTHSCSRRKALKLLGFSTASALVAMGCQSTAAQVFAPTGRPLKTSRFKTIRLDDMGQIMEKISKRASYFDEPALRSRLRRVLPLRMVQIPAGEFLMGSPATEANRDSQEGPQRKIQVPSFYMGAFTITQRQYAAVMDNNPSYFTDEQSKDGANLPVEQVTWQEAVEFCQQLSALSGRTYRLPSEAEWEYACRAGTTTTFCFGEKLTTETANYFADFAILDTENYEENYRNTPVAVDSFWPNAFGLHNMHGNVMEWCADDYHTTYEGAPADATPWLSNQPNASKIMRGGSWFNDTPLCRSAARDKNTQDGRSNAFGFRVVCTG